MKRETVSVDIADDTPPIVGIFVIEGHSNRAHSVTRLDPGEKRLVSARDNGGVEQEKGAACVGALIARRANVAAFANVARSLGPLASATRCREGVVDLNETRTRNATFRV